MITEVDLAPGGLIGCDYIKHRRKAMIILFEYSPFPPSVTAIGSAVVMVALLPWIEPPLDIPDRIRRNRKRSK